MNMLKKIDSSKKANLSYVAIGDYQGEFSDLNESRFLLAYRFNGQTYKEMLINLTQAKVTELNDSEYQIIFGKHKYILKFENKNNQIKAQLTQYLWHWLPYQRFIGKVSNSAMTTIANEIKCNINSCVV